MHVDACEYMWVHVVGACECTRGCSVHEWVWFGSHHTGSVLLLIGSPGWSWTSTTRWSVYGRGPEIHRALYKHYYLCDLWPNIADLVRGCEEGGGGGGWGGKCGGSGKWGGGKGKKLASY